MASWAMKGLSANFPLALDAAHDRVIVVCRRPPKLGLFRPQDGQLIAEAVTCEDSDDAFLDAMRARIYVTKEQERLCQYLAVLAAILLAAAAGNTTRSPQRRLPGTYDHDEPRGTIQHWPQLQTSLHRTRTVNAWPPN